MVLIVDVRRGLEAEEDELLAFLAHVGLPAAVVATKLDKLGRDAGRRAVDALAARVGEKAPVLGFSARTGEGRTGLWRLIGDWLEQPRA